MSGDEEDKKPAADDDEEEDEEDLEKLQEEIARMEAEAARITKETEELEKKKEAKLAGSGGGNGGGDANKSSSAASGGTTGETPNRDGYVRVRGILRRTTHLVHRRSLTVYLFHSFFSTTRHSVYVGQVDYSATPEELLSHFEACGTVERVTIVCDKFSGKPKGTSFDSSRRSPSLSLYGLLASDITNQPINQPRPFSSFYCAGFAYLEFSVRGRGREREDPETITPVVHGFCVQNDTV